jgi:hypothetical protein
MMNVRASEASDKKYRENHNGFSSVKYASEKRSKIFQPQAEPNLG